MYSSGYWKSADDFLEGLRESRLPAAMKIEEIKRYMEKRSNSLSKEEKILMLGQITELSKSIEGRVFHSGVFQ